MLSTMDPGPCLTAGGCELQRHLSILSARPVPEDFPIQNAANNNARLRRLCDRSSRSDGMGPRGGLLGPFKSPVHVSQNAGA